MRIENIKNDFPKMPQGIRDMMEKEVEKQIHMETKQKWNTKLKPGRTLAASIAAVMIFSTTVFAGVSIYRMQREPVGRYGVDVKVVKDADSQTVSKSADDTGDGTSVAIEDVRLQVGYLPKGMVQTEEGKYSFEDHLYQGGVSIVFYRMDTGDSAFDMLHDDVLSSEYVTINGHEGVYLEYPNLFGDETIFNQRIYVAYPDLHYVMQMFAAADVSKDEALKIAEGIRLLPAKNASDGDIVHAWNWSDYLGSLKEQKKEEQAAESFEVKVTASKQEMNHTHAIGESFPLFSYEEGKAIDCGLSVKVSDVKISDDYSLLKTTVLDEDLLKETDENGKLLPAEIRYIKEGNADALSEVVKIRKVPQKLIYAAVEYTNTTDKELTDVLFFGTLQRISEKNGEMHMMQEYEQPSKSDQWTRVENAALSSMKEMQYYDVHGGERQNNYITSIKPGETVTVHMGWLVTEEELDKLYLSLDTSAASDIFTESALLTGYVDIRNGIGNENDKHNE